MEDDPFLRKFQPSELKIASEFLTNCLPFLSRDLCKDCVNVLSDRIRSLDPGIERCFTKLNFRVFIIGTNRWLQSSVDLFAFKVIDFRVYTTMGQS